METFQLIQGTYNGAEAAEVLLSVIDDKIKYHNKKNFSLKERFGVESEESTKRLKELKADRKKIEEMIENPDNKSAEFTISSSINITVNVLA